MSTPVFEENKRASSADVDLTVRMQHMIDLQNDQMKMSEEDPAHLKTTKFRRGEPPESTAPVPSDTSRHSLGAKTMSRSVRGDLNQLAGQPDTTIDSTNFEFQEQGVGRGILFNTDKLGSAATASIIRSEESKEDGRLQMSMAMPVRDSRGGITYGSVDAPLPASSALPEISHNDDLNTSRNQIHDYTRGPPYQYQGQRGQTGYAAQNHHHYRQSTCDMLLEALKMCCSSLWRLFCGLLCCCFTDVEQLQRSFCYGAIDGFLTGSGLVATFCGMNVLAPTSTLVVRSFVVAFSAAACFADSLCMALGHVWTTHVLVSAQVKERTATRARVDQNRADAKGKLVDLLLERGMLKIDAMSLADTLEGYPDMFVSALVGDALIAGGVGSNSDSSIDLSMRHRSLSGGGKVSPSVSRGWGSGHHWNGVEDQHQAADSGGNGNFISWKFPSYGQDLDELEQEIDPEAAVVGAAMTESRREGLFMMIGFSVFAVVPSLIYLICPIFATPSKHSTRELDRFFPSDADDLNGGSTTATSVAITVAAVIMWCLGVWKSRFLDSNWMLFGIETVVVMLVCIAAGYGVGSLLRAFVPGLNAIDVSSTKS